MRAATPFRRWANLGLLVAALLQFAGASAGPWAHEYGRGISTGHTLCAPDRHGPHDPVSHDELGCWLWQAFTAVAPPPADAPPSLRPEGPVRGLPAEVRAPSSLAVARPRARAPPVS
ncbi:MAG TPA: hypothetical protein VHG51_01340 [Longimicrobiaceae bacterium]|nr:hypothetical protein [Longimicrobiaceae bacterium]